MNNTIIKTDHLLLDNIYLINEDEIIHIVKKIMNTKNDIYFYNIICYFCKHIENNFLVNNIGSKSNIIDIYKYNLQQKLLLTTISTDLFELIIDYRGYEFSLYLDVYTNLFEKQVLQFYLDNKLLFDYNTLSKQFIRYGNENVMINIFINILKSC